MKIDCHIHITPPDVIKQYKKIGIKEPYFRLLSETPHNKFATAEMAAAHLKENQFDKGVVFGFAFQDMGLCQYVNDYTMEAVKNNPDLFIGFMVAPVHHPHLEVELERGYCGGLRGIGELFPHGQKMNLEQVHKTALKQCCMHYQLPVLLHTNEEVGHDYAGKTNVSMKKIEEFVKSHQDITIILAHFGGGILFYELMKEVKEQFRNVYYDTAAGLFLYDKKIYQVIQAAGISEKIVFGSDYPLLPIGRYMTALQDLEQSYQQDICGRNIETVFGKLGLL